jgi:two-component system phosphate regulon response regulator PhoB
MGVERTVFVVENDMAAARLIARELEGAGYSTRVFDTTANVMVEAAKDRPSLYVINVTLPDGNALELCREIRQTPALSEAPIIFLTAQDGEQGVIGLEMGADDYLTKPLSPREFLARVGAVMRRFKQPQPPAGIRVGDLEIDAAAMSLTVAGKPVMTTATEFRLLEFLARHPGRVFTRDQLLDAAWHSSAPVSRRSVDVYVRRLREKIEPDPDSPRLLKTMRGAGYRFESLK